VEIKLILIINQKLKMQEKKLIKQILQGKIFIYPTDTIYGIGCNALNKNAVNKIRLIKQRDDNPFSIIAPNINWIKKHLIINIDLEKYLPGPYTLILKKKKKDFLSHVSNTESLGIRIPDCDFTSFIQKSKTPFITTSVNISGKKPITKIKEIPKQIKDKVDIIIDIGPLTGRPSTLIKDGKEIKR
jgi:L-threonylcarbamoyladenylate synthase